MRLNTSVPRSHKRLEYTPSTAKCIVACTCPTYWVRLLIHLTVLPLHTSSFPPTSAPCSAYNFALSGYMMHRNKRASHKPLMDHWRYLHVVVYSSNFNFTSWTSFTLIKLWAWIYHFCMVGWMCYFEINKKCKALSQSLCGFVTMCQSHYEFNTMEIIA